MSQGFVLYLCHIPLVQVQDSDDVIVGVGNEQGPTRGVQTETARLRELSMLKGTVHETTVARPGQRGTPFGCRVNHLDLGKH